MYKDPITGEETHYIIDGKNYKRVTRFTSEPFVAKTDKQRRTQKNSSEAGVNIHFVVIENILRGKQPKKPSNISAIAFLDLMTQSRAMKEKIAKEGVVVATERVVYAVDLKNASEKDKVEYAGRLDILVKLKNGKYRLIDLKTGSEQGLTDYENENSFTDPETKITTVTKSKRQQHGSQLSALAYALRNIAMRNDVKIDIQDGQVYYLPIGIQEEDGLVKKVSKFAVKQFNLSYDIKKVLGKEITFEQKATSPASAPEVRSAGSNKAKVKTNVKVDEETPDTKTVAKAKAESTGKPRTAKRKEGLKVAEEEPAKKTTTAKGAPAKATGDKIAGEGLEEKLRFTIVTLNSNIETIMEIYNNDPSNRAQGKTINAEEAADLEEKIREKYC
jgi:hypothetical protein